MPDQPSSGLWGIAVASSVGLPGLQIAASFKDRVLGHRSYLLPYFPEPVCSPQKDHRLVPDPVGQGDALLVRQGNAPLYLFQKRPLGRVGGGPFQGLLPFAPALLFLGVCEGHTDDGTVT